MMVRKRHRPGHFDTAGAQLSKESGRRRNACHGKGRAWRTGRVTAERRAHTAYHLEHRRRKTGSFDYDTFFCQNCVRDHESIERFTKTPSRQGDRVCDVVSPDEHDLHISVELQVLKTIVQDVNCRAEMMLGEAPGEVPILTHEHADARELSREHQRFVTRSPQIASNPGGVPDDDDAFNGLLTTVATAQDRRAFPRVPQHACDAGRNRRFASTTHGKIADADHRAAQPPAKLGNTSVALPPTTRCGSVERAEHVR